MTEILWLVPETPDAVSHGRALIAETLEKRGYSITMRRASLAPLRKSWDCIIGTTRKGGLLAPIRAIDTPIIIDHVDPIAQFYETDNRALATLVNAGELAAFQLADYTLYVYESERDRVGESATKTRLPVDTALFDAPPQTNLNERLQQRGISPGFIVYCGGLEPRYNIATLCEVAQHTDRELVIAGDGSKRETVEQATQRHESLHYLSTLPHHQVPALLNHAGVGLQLVDDPHTVTVLEYGLADLPTVHLEGTAEQRLPDCVEFVPNHPEQIARACTDVHGQRMPELQRFARKHSVETVASDYQAAICEVTQ